MLCSFWAAPRGEVSALVKFLRQAFLRLEPRCVASLYVASRCEQQCGWDQGEICFKWRSRGWKCPCLLLHARLAIPNAVAAFVSQHLIGTPQ